VSLNGRVKRLQQLKRNRSNLGAFTKRIGKEKLTPEQRQTWRWIVHGVPQAVAHVRRAEIDQDKPGCYGLHTLRGLDTHHLGLYTVALSHLKHPHQDEARAMLRDRKDAGNVLRFVDKLLERLGGISAGT
jgi:hypothetical protein